MTATSSAQSESAWWNDDRVDPIGESRPDTSQGLEITRHMLRTTTESLIRQHREAAALEARGRGTSDPPIADQMNAVADEMARARRQPLAFLLQSERTVQEAVRNQDVLDEEIARLLRARRAAPVPVAEPEEQADPRETASIPSVEDASSPPEVQEPVAAVPAAQTPSSVFDASVDDAPVEVTPGWETDQPTGPWAEVQEPVADPITSEPSATFFEASAGSLRAQQDPGMSPMTSMAVPSRGRGRSSWAALALGAIAGVLILVVALVSVLENMAPLGWTVSPVFNASMEPTVSFGSLLVTQSVPASALKTSDVIVVSDPTRPDTSLPRRVLAIAANAGQEQVTLKGDANSVPDAQPLTLAQDQTVARALFDVPRGGTVLVWLNEPYSKPGLLALAVALLTLASVWERKSTRLVRPVAADPSALPEARWY